MCLCLQAAPKPNPLNAWKGGSTPIQPPKRPAQALQPTAAPQAATFADRAANGIAVVQPSRQPAPPPPRAAPSVVGAAFRSPAAELAEPEQDVGGANLSPGFRWELFYVTAVAFLTKSWNE